MQIRIVAGFLCVLCCAAALTADGIKRGTYPFMAFIYYQDETVLNMNGRRFLQGAVLIRPTFLISSSPESSISKNPLSKTLLARVGATVIDAKFTLNEDEDEQEREVIEITRPYHHNSTKYWATDISLLKTLQPFKPTLSVDIAQLAMKQPEVGKKGCKILFFKKTSGTDVRLLSRMSVEILPPSVENCGEKFITKTMACGSNDNTQISNFCHGNSGGPLICENSVFGVQTYINGDCSTPFLYQLLDQRKRFLDCGVNEQCSDMQECQHVCSVTLKDAPLTTIRPVSQSTSAKLTTTPAQVIQEKVTEATKLSPESAEIKEPARKIEALTSGESSEARDSSENSESKESGEKQHRNSNIFENSDSVEVTERTVSTMSRPTTTIKVADTTPVTTTTASHDEQGRRQNEGDIEMNVVDVQAHKQKPVSWNRATSNILVIQNFVYSVLLLSICLM